MALTLNKSVSGVRVSNARALVRPKIANRKAFVATQALFGGFFAPKAKAPVKRVVRPTVIPESAYNIPISLLAIAGVEAYEGWIPVAAFTAVLGAFLGIQATRIRFQFDDEGLGVIKAGEETENVFVGGTNKWSYDAFVNWEYWFPSFPILVYFKETQTKPEGQIHFFPIIFNGKQLYDVMVERCGPSMGSGPKENEEEEDEE